MCIICCACTVGEALLTPKHYTADAWPIVNALSVHASLLVWCNLMWHITCARMYCRDGPLAL